MLSEIVTSLDALFVIKLLDLVSWIESRRR